MTTTIWTGIRPLDVVLTVILTGLGSWLMVMNIVSDDAAVRIDSRSWLIVPVFLAATIPVLWWRRTLTGVLLVSCTAMALHVLAFGSLVRCGAGLPLVFVLAFLCGMRPNVRDGMVPLGLTAILGSAVLLRDTAAGPSLIPVVLVLNAGLFGIGRVVAHRAAMAIDLQQRNEDLRLLRDERAALEVSDDRALMSARLETLLDERLSQLAAAASGGAGEDAATTKALLLSLEEDSRRTLGDMREIVGLLRGGEVSLAPAPSVAHLDALLARHLRTVSAPGSGDGTDTCSRLQVTGDPRVLPASVELSAYRIVEHLVTALADSPSAPVSVGMRFTDDALEIQVSGPVTRNAELRAAAGRARERTRLHAGSLDVKVTRGQARVVAHLPVMSGV